MDVALRTLDDPHYREAITNHMLETLAQLRDPPGP